VTLGDHREPPAHILLVCTANQCRSPLAGVLLSAALTTRGVAAEIETAGLGGAGQAATDHAVTVAARRDLDLHEHRSQPLEPELVSSADLVIGMERLHVRTVVLAAPPAWSYTFTLKEFVRRAEAVEARPAGSSLTSWIAQVHEGRRHHDLLGASRLDDVDDPTGGTLAEHEDIARELEDLLERLVRLAWPPAILHEIVWRP